MIAVYARVSTEEQAKTGYSLQDQVRQCREKAGNPADVIEYVDDGYSGEFLERPALTKLRRDVKEGLISKVYVYDPDRLSRNLMNALIVTNEFERRAELTFVSGDYDKTPMGKFFFNMKASFAEYEKGLINERMSRGRREKARQGRVVRDYQVYGYTYDKVNERFEVNENEANVVKLIFELFTNPQGRVKGINGIALMLTENGVPTKRDVGVWHRQVVRQILMNRAYIGEFYQNRWNTEGMLGNRFKSKEDRISMTLRPVEEWILVPCPAIIETDVFEYAQKLIEESRRRSSGAPKNEYFLSGLVRCGDCGNTMTGRKSKNWGKYIFEYTDTKNTAGAKYRGCGSKIKCEDLDSFVWDTFVNVMINKGAVLAEAAAASENALGNEVMRYEELEQQRINNELERVKTGRKKLLNFMMNNSDVIDEEEIRNQLKELKEKEERLREDLEQIIQQLRHFEDEKFSEEVLLETVEQFLQQSAPESLSLSEKRDFVRRIFREIRVYRDGKVEFIRI